MNDTDTNVQTDTDTPGEPAGHPAVSEARKYRKRAQAAEQQLAQLQDEVQNKANKLIELEQQVQHLEQTSRIDQLLVQSDAVDLDAARLLTAIAVDQMDQPDVDAAVAELRRTKPFLFRARTHTSSALSARPDTPTVHHDMEDAADEASATGNRTDLLRYLRLKRTTRSER